MTAAHIYTAASCSAATHSGPSGSSALWSEAGLRQVRGKQPFRYCLLIDCICPHPRLLASGRSPQCIEGISFTKSFTLKNRVLHLVVRELTSMPQSPQPLTAMRSRCAEMASIFGLAWRLARRLRSGTLRLGRRLGTGARSRHSPDMFVYTCSWPPSPTPRPVGA